MMERLGLKRHSAKTRLVDLRPGKESFCLLGLYASQAAKGAAEPARALQAALAVAPSDETPLRARWAIDLRPGQRGEGGEEHHRGAEPGAPRMGQLLAQRNAEGQFNQVDHSVYQRLTRWLGRRCGQRMRRERGPWTHQRFYDLGLYRRRGTVRYPAPATPRRSSLSRVREIRRHGLKGVS